MRKYESGFCHIYPCLILCVIASNAWGLDNSQLESERRLFERPVYLSDDNELLDSIRAVIESTPEQNQTETRIRLYTDALNNVSSRSLKARLHISLGQIYMREGRNEKAKQSYRSAFESYGDTDMGLQAAGLLLDAHQQEYDYDSAAILAAEILRVPNLKARHDVHFSGRLGLFLMATGNKEEGIAVVNQLMSRHSELSEQIAAQAENVAVTASGLGYSDSYYNEMAWIEKRMPSYASSERFLGNYAHACLSVGKPEQALENYIRALETNPHGKRAPEFLLEIGNLYKQAGDIFAAYKFYKQLIAFESDDEYVVATLKELARRNLITIERAMGIEEAERLVRKSINEMHLSLDSEPSPTSKDRIGLVFADDNALILSGNGERQSRGIDSFSVIALSLIVVILFVGLTWMLRRRIMLAQLRHRDIGKDNLTILIIAATSALIVSGNLSAEIAEPHGPTISIQEEYLDFGNVYEGRVERKSLNVQNTSPNPVKITSVKTSCGCVSSEWPRDPLQPGEQGEILVDLDSTGRDGPYHGKVFIFLGESTTTPLIADVHAHVNPMVTVEPAMLSLKGLTVGESMQAELLVRAHKPVDIDVIPIAPEGVISIQPNSVQINSVPSVLQISVTPSELGNLAYSLAFKIASHNGETSTLIVPVSLKVEGPVVTEPSALWFASANGAKREKILEIRWTEERTDPPLILDTLFNEDVLSVATKTVNGDNITRLSVTPKASAFSSLRTLETHIRLQIANQEESAIDLEIPVTFLRRPAEREQTTAGFNAVDSKNLGLTVQAPLPGAGLQPFLVTNAGATVVYYTPRDGRFRTGWTAPPAGKLTFDEFSVTVNQDIGLVRGSLSSCYPTVTLDGNNCGDSVLLSFVERLSSRVPALEGSEDDGPRTLLVILRPPSPSQDVIESIWDRVLGAKEMSVMLVVPKRLTESEISSLKNMTSD
jgi:tetratricopeptide (TPR) repeat protein